MNRYSILFIIIVAGILLVYYGWPNTQTADKNKTTQKILYWVAPMDPNYRRDEPGKSPMGMDLVPIYADQDVSEKNSVKISSQMVNNLGVRVAVVKKNGVATHY